MAESVRSAEYKGRSVASVAGTVLKEPIGKTVLIGRNSKTDELQKFATYRSVAAGIPFRSVREIESQGLTRDDIRQIIPDRTLDRRIASGENLKIEEADGIARLLRVVNAAREVFEDAALADEWLRSPNPALGDLIPIQMARTDIGGREVEAVLIRLSHGVY